MVPWDWFSFVIGLLVGMIIIVALVWVAYIGRMFAFSTCVGSQRPCAPGDYFLDPGEAVRNGIEPGEVFFVQNGILRYKRAQRNGTCTPNTNRTIIIDYPLYCSFTDAAGATHVARALAPGSSTYTYTDNDGQIVTIVANENCQPATNNVVTGTPLPRWDAI